MKDSAPRLKALNKTKKEAIPTWIKREKKSETCAEQEG